MEAPNWATAGGIEDVTIQLEERCRVALRSQRLGRPGRPGGNQWSTWLLETSHVFTGSFFYTKLESFPSKIRVSYIYIYIIYIYVYIYFSPNHVQTVLMQILVNQKMP